MENKDSFKLSKDKDFGVLIATENIENHRISTAENRKQIEQIRKK